MDGLLTAVKTVSRDSAASSLSAAESKPPALARRDIGPDEEPARDPTSSGYILDVLKSKPDRDALSQVLGVLDPSNKKAEPSQFDIRVPSPTSAQILQVLVSVTVPDVWDSLNTKSKEWRSAALKLRAALLRCLCSVAGVSSLVAQLRFLITACRSSSEQAKGDGSEIRIRDILDVLSALLEPKDFLLRIYTDISTICPNETQKQITWREFTSLIAASRVLSTVAESLMLVSGSSALSNVSWVGEGPRYVSWIGDNICQVVSKIDQQDEFAWKAISSFMGRALSLGYTGNLKIVILYYHG
jgi:telomere length regulation protein